MPKALCSRCLSYNRIPWMQDAPICSEQNVLMSGPNTIEWPDLDMDLEIESLRHLERYPLVIKRDAIIFVRKVGTHVNQEDW